MDILKKGAGNYIHHPVSNTLLLRKDYLSVLKEKSTLLRILSTVQPVMLLLSNEKALVLNAVYRSQISTLFESTAKLETAYGKCVLKHTFVCVCVCFEGRLKSV